MRAPELVEARIANGGRAIFLVWDDGWSETLPVLWLDDNADDVFDPVTGQRRRSLCELDPDARLQSVSLDGEGLIFRGGAGERRIARHRLRARRPQAVASCRWLTPHPFQDIAPISARDFLNRDDALREALERLARLGLAVLASAPAEPGVVETLVSRFGFIRETNYGRMFEVRSEAVPSNLAYTAQGLDLHTDNPYREPVPTLQLLLAIRSDDQGGETCFVDGVAHAEAMAALEPQAFARLAGEPVDFLYTAPDGAVYCARRPVIACDVRGAPQAIHLNHRSLAPLTMAADSVADWYAAYAAFHHRVHRPEARLPVHLRPGDVVLFDNCRILHGRTGFRPPPDGEGRWLQGCYADIDGALATLARLTARAAKPGTIGQPD